MTGKAMLHLIRKEFRVLGVHVVQKLSKNAGVFHAEVVVFFAVKWQADSLIGGRKRVHFYLLSQRIES